MVDVVRAVCELIACVATADAVVADAVGRAAVGAARDLARSAAPSRLAVAVALCTVAAPVAVMGALAQ